MGTPSTSLPHQDLRKILWYKFSKFKKKNLIPNFKAKNGLNHLIWKIKNEKKGIIKKGRVMVNRAKLPTNEKVAAIPLPKIHVKSIFLFYLFYVQCSD